LTQSEIRESFGTLFSTDHSPQNRSTALAKRVASDACQLDVGILEDFLNAACNPRMLLRQTGSRPSKIAQIANQHRGYEAAPQESVLQKFRDPLTVFRICLASWNSFDVLCVGQQDLKVTFENVPHWLPINACGLHCDGPYST